MKPYIVEVSELNKEGHFRVNVVFKTRLIIKYLECSARDLKITKEAMDDLVRLLNAAYVSGREDAK